MKTIAAASLFALSFAASAASTVYVDGYVRKDGTYVPPHARTSPDSSRSNNWSSQGNVNPYTGERGSVNPYATPPSTYNPPIYTPPRRYY